MEFYIINMCHVLNALLIVSVAGLFCLTVFTLCVYYDTKDIADVTKLHKIIKWEIIVLVILTVLVIFTPNRQDAASILGLSPEQYKALMSSWKACE